MECEECEFYGRASDAPDSVPMTCLYGLNDEQIEDEIKPCGIPYGF